MDYAHYVRSNRRELGITQDDLAQHLGLARTTIVAIESGQRKLRASELSALRQLGFPDSGALIEDDYMKIGDTGWMTVSEDERRLMKAYRLGSIETVMRLTLAHKDGMTSDKNALPFDEVENG